jgi:hypothetical protein
MQNVTIENAPQSEGAITDQMPKKEQNPLKRKKQTRENVFSTTTSSQVPSSQPSTPQNFERCHCGGQKKQPLYFFLRPYGFVTCLDGTALGRRKSYVRPSGRKAHFVD